MNKGVDFKYADFTHQIIGCAMNVHSYLGNGFQEIIYQRALAIELNKSNLEFKRELEQQIYYRDYPDPIGTRRADFVIADKVLVEIKAISNLEDVHFAQIINYLRVYRFEIGLLINFGEKSLKFKRFILDIQNPKSVESGNPTNL